jgi:C-terminal peptidase prc
MYSKIIQSIVLLIFCKLLSAHPVAAAERYPILHEVLRHFEVAFVDKANMTALLAGGLHGIKAMAPGCEIQISTLPDLFTVKAGRQSIALGGKANMSFKQLETVLTSAMDLVLTAKLVDKPSLLEHAVIRQLVGRCGDPWSVYLESDLYSRLLDDGATQRGDVGLLFEESKDGLRVLDVTPGSPAEAAGIKIGHKVDSVGGRPDTSLNELDALALTRGKIGDMVALVLEGKNYQLQCATESKQNIVVDTPPGGIARVRLLNFRAGTGKHLKSLLPKIEKEYQGQLKGLVLDLRGNPGGLVTEGAEVVGLFINGGRVVSVDNRTHNQSEIEESHAPGPYRNLPLALLVDHRSASVSELVALALHDYKRAKLIGATTLGKGTVQVVLELSDGSALKLSTGRYFSPQGAGLYTGLDPDIEVPWNGTGEDVQLKKAFQSITLQ